MTRRGIKVPKPPKRSRFETWLDGVLVTCAVLAIDPGEDAGAALFVPGDGGPRLVWARAVDTNSLELEACIADAIAYAAAHGLVLVLAMEEWGAGGMRGIDQWLGLGAMAGAWKRAALLMCDRSRPTLVKSRLVVRTAQTKWRSAIIESSGTRDEETGKYRPFDSEGWKKAANARVLELFGHLETFDSNASEAVLLGYFACRDPRIAALIPTGGKRRAVA